MTLLQSVGLAAPTEVGLAVFPFGARYRPALRDAPDGAPPGGDRPGGPSGGPPSGGPPGAGRPGRDRHDLLEEDG